MLIPKYTRDSWFLGPSSILYPNYIISNSFSLFAFPFFLEQASTTKAAIAKALSLSNPLLYQAVIQVILLWFRSILAAMATSDHVPEVCFQVPVFQILVITLYFLFSQIYSIWFLGNKEQNFDSIGYCSPWLFSWAYGWPWFLWLYSSRNQPNLLQTIYSRFVLLEHQNSL